MIFCGIFGGYAWLVLAALHPKLPTPEKPFILYSNHLRQDLKLTVLRALKQAQSRILLHIYELSDPSILDLLTKRHADGLQMAIFHDKKRALPKGLPAHPVKTRGLMHRKILVIDDTLVLLGTANFTTQSLKMHDNLILGIWDRAFAQFFADSSASEGKFHVGGLAIQCFLLPDSEGRAAAALGKHIDEAAESIRVAMFTLTHPVLVEKLAEAQKRGVEVTVAVDRYTAMGASKKAVERLQEAKARVLVNYGSQLLHHKWAVIDGKTLVLGSANWTAAAFKKNQDCLLILENLSISDRRIVDRIWRGVAIGSEKL